ncbi:MAG: hypothetical protein ACE5JH_11140, partial [Acidobacteriota bacterium]
MLVTSRAPARSGLRTAFGALIAVISLCLAAPASADKVVYFLHGKAIRVKSVQKGDRFTVLELEGGGTLGVPTSRIARIEEYEISAPIVQAPASGTPLVAGAATSSPAGAAAARQAGRRAGAAPGGAAQAQSPARLQQGPGVGGKIAGRAAPTARTVPIGAASTVPRVNPRAA